MTITPEQADRLKRDATDGPWDVERSDNATLRIIERIGPVESACACEGLSVDDPDIALIAAAPDMAETIAGMEVEWGVEHDNMASSPFPRRWTQWYDDETKARNSAAVLAGMGKHPVLVRRLVSSPEVIDGE